MPQPKGCTAPPIVFLLLIILCLVMGWLWGNRGGGGLKPTSFDETSSNPLPIPLPGGDPLKKLNETELMLPSGVDYRFLRELLRQNKWQEADQETKERLQEAAGVTGQELSSTDAMRISCEDLALVDRLWSSYSDKRFGFKAQWSVLQDSGIETGFSEALWKTFGNRVGWRMNSQWLQYEEMKFERGAPIGHLPRLVYGDTGEVLPTMLEAYDQQSCGSGQPVDSSRNNDQASTVPAVATTRTTRGLSRFRAETVTVDSQGNIDRRQTIEPEYFTERINGVGIDMVAISGGTFWMGSPSGEEGGQDNEKPQHEVTVQPFFMGKTEVTQAQWRAVAQLPQINRSLNPDPSHFKGDNRPVEQVSWDDAQEFIARLSKATGKAYQLPSEAAWEYAPEPEPQRPSPLVRP
jgi:hypothetical protein